MQSHRRQPTRIPCPWDSPGKNTGVGCHFLLQCIKVKSESEVAQSCPTLCNPMDCSLPGSSVHGIFQTRVLEWVATAFSTYQDYQLPISYQEIYIYIYIFMCIYIYVYSNRKLILSSYFTCLAKIVGETDLTEILLSHYSTGSLLSSLATHIP